MLLNYLYNKATTEIIEFDVKHSKCVNYRYSKSNCNECVSVCRYEAIDLDNNLTINQDKCTNCLMCTSVCKTEALDAKIPINQLIAISNKQKHILIGCTKTIPTDNFGKSCIGWLSDEYLIFLASLFPLGVKIFLGSCNKCENNEVCQDVKLRVTKLKDKKNLGHNFPIEYFYESKQITNYTHKLNRRDFFNGMGKSLKNETAKIFSKDEVLLYNYGDTTLPNRQVVVSYLLNGENRYKGYVSDLFTYNVKKNNNCNYCEECSAACPVNALLIDEDHKTFEFVVDKCVGCGLCKAFCDISGLDFNHTIDLVY